MDGRKVKPGFAGHTAGYPFRKGTFGGGFLYVDRENLLSLGIIIGLEYKNPYLNLYEELQRFKLHPLVANLIEGGQQMGYGARVIEEGGFYSLPKKPGIPGLLMVGSAAGYLDFSKLKGVHSAIRSGKMAAESAFKAIAEHKVDSIADIQDETIKKSKIYSDLFEVRGNPGLYAKHFWLGAGLTGLSSLRLARRLVNWLPFKVDQACCDATKKASECSKVVYPPHDDVRSFNIDKSLAASGVDHEYDQPCHLKVKGDAKEYADIAINVYDKPEERFCPGKVFEFSDGELKFNPQNCLHCKACTIKVGLCLTQ